MEEALLPDGSIHQNYDGGGWLAAGELAVYRVSLIHARQALETYIKWNGKMQVTRNGAKNAVVNLIEPLSGKQFTTATGRLTMKGCREALAECIDLINRINASAVVIDTDA